MERNPPMKSRSLLRREKDAVDLACVIRKQHLDVQGLEESIRYNEHLLYELNEQIEEDGGIPGVLPEDDWLNRAEKVMRRKNWRINAR